MSPVALPNQQAAVLYGPKDLRVDDRTLWPPQHGHAQVSIVATGLCGSDRTSSLSPLNLFSHIPLSTQCITISTAGTVILPYKHP